MALDEPKDTDETCEHGGVTFLIDRELRQSLGKVSVDFLQRGWRTGFVVSSEKPIGVGLGSCGSGGCSC